jgi:hypothetical protein
MQTGYKVKFMDPDPGPTKPKIYISINFIAAMFKFSLRENLDIAGGTRQAS